jgi:hypothetical protein
MRLFATHALAPLALAFALAAAPPALAGAEGTYNVVGTNPGDQGGYAGTVTVEQVGENVFSLQWSIGNNQAIGTAVGDDDFLSVGYKSGDNFGVALFIRDGEQWNGVWTYGGGKEIGQETWAPQ